MLPHFKTCSSIQTGKSHRHAEGAITESTPEKTFADPITCWTLCPCVPGYRTDLHSSGPRSGPTDVQLKPAPAQKPAPGHHWTLPDADYTETWMTPSCSKTQLKNEDKDFIR
ncbi:Hypothetical predicted protein [Xyrichtys novacula]|uniref:Prolactin receptor n=1 Tax=Xyrichtys novacula TaxID=13765 RepID=A0AAV1H7D3_XYRNO|nr:Hypothetical predicted protein [Xyrichtys novacula]